jgi:DnaJ-domain-containing protein 1
MSEQFQVDLDGSSRMLENDETTAWLGLDQPEHASQFADGVRRVLGDDSDPDPLFFEETWSVGASTALENWHKRQQSAQDCKCESRVLHEPRTLGSFVLMERSEWNMDYFLSAHAAAIAGRDEKVGSWQSPQEPHAGTENECVHEHTMQVEDSGNNPATTDPMTELSASRLLGVTANSTREQVRSAYRRLVGQWHPDRLDRGSNEARQLATEHMATINEAYSLMRVS